MIKSKALEISLFPKAFYFTLLFYYIHHTTKPTLTKYGPPEVVKLMEVEKPVPKDNEVLIKVHAATVNCTDCGFRSAEHFVSRFFSGLSSELGKNSANIFLALLTPVFGGKKVLFPLPTISKKDVVF